MESQTRISPCWVTATPCGFVNSPRPRPRLPTASMRSSSAAVLLPRLAQLLALLGRAGWPGVDRLLRGRELLLLLAGRGSEAE